MEQLDNICCLASELGKHVSNYCMEKGYNMTTIKLEKLMVMADGVFLSLYGKPLFKEEVVVMNHGVGIKEIDSDFWCIFLDRDKKEFYSYITLLEKQEKVLKKIVKHYGNLDAFELNKIPEIQRTQAFIEETNAKGSILHGGMMRIFEKNLAVWELQLDEQHERVL